MYSDFPLASLYKYCDVAWENRIIRRPLLDNVLLKTIAEQRSVNIP
jgi:hypothetical protein